MFFAGSPFRATPPSWRETLPFGVLPRIAHRTLLNEINHIGFLRIALVSYPVDLVDLRSRSFATACAPCSLALLRSQLGDVAPDFTVGVVVDLGGLRVGVAQETTDVVEWRAS
jgi:hypothetical protein